jgi:CheY-like chemotaxis protein
MMKHSAKILVVEDNVLNLKMAKKLLEIAGYQTIDAANADDSIRLAIQQSPDLILMDMHMPGKNGYVASKELKSIPQTAHIPIVAFTALAMPEEQKKAIEHGCVGIISKPIDAVNFAKTVGSFLPVSSESNQASPETGANSFEHVKIVLAPQAMLLKEFLEPLGYQLIPTGDKQKPSFSLGNFDLFILDESYMASLDSQMLSELKNELSQRGIPTILVTSFEDRDILAKAAGWVVDYLNPPFLPVEVEMRILSAISSNRGGKRRNQIEDTEILDERLEDFLQTASHDIQGPIRKISQFVNFLSQEKLAADSESEYYLAGISRNVKKIESVLANLLSSIKS